MIFFKLIIVTFLMCLMHIMTNLGVLNLLIDDGSIPYQIMVYVAIFFNFCALPFLGQLIYRHVKLQRAGLTTYEFIRLMEGKAAIASKIKKEKTDKQLA